jgi:hypothetical protein
VRIHIHALHKHSTLPVGSQVMRGMYLAGAMLVDGDDSRASFADPPDAAGRVAVCRHRKHVIAKKYQRRPGRRAGRVGPTPSARTIPRMVGSDMQQIAKGRGGRQAVIGLALAPSYRHACCELEAVGERLRGRARTG